MENSQRGFVLPLLLVIIAAVLVGGMAYVYTHSQQQTLPVVVDTEETPTPTTNSNPFPPNGWFVHILDISNLQNSKLISNTILTKQKVLPNCEGTEGACYGRQIDIAVLTTTLTPDAYVANLLQNVFPSNKTWSTLSGHKVFRMRYPTDANSTPTEGTYLFSGNKVYEILFYPSAQEDMNDFDQVVAYYVTSVVK